MNCQRKWMTDKASSKIFDALDGKVRFVGGCVRDAILGIDAKDTDLATEIPPEETIKALKESKIKVIPTGLKHGTVTAVIDSKSYEITTLRRDVACDGRHAEVEFTDDWQEDAARRDFTMNAMSCDQEGNVYDYFGGIEDLQKGLVRFVGNAENRCNEDVLRVLRFFRFNAYYGSGALDSDGLKACIKTASKIPNLSGERIQAEMIKLLSAPDPTEVLSIMQKEKIDEYIFTTSVNISSLGSILKLEEWVNPLLRLAGLVGSTKLSESGLKRICKYWKLSNKDGKYLKDVLFGKYNSQDWKPNLRKQGREVFESICILNGNLELVRESRGWEVPQFPLSGGDLKSIGFKEGKEIGVALKKAEDFWEEKDYKSSKQELIDFLKS